VILLTMVFCHWMINVRFEAAARVWWVRVPNSWDAGAQMGARVFPRG